jgi:MinD-like ATPase involved in chromosome partitioning or flagellar assembly
MRRASHPDQRDAREAPRVPRPRSVVGRTAAPDAGSNVVLVASGKGGVGTSVVASLLALSAASAAGARVLLVDASESGGTLHHLLGVRPTHSLWMLKDARTTPADVLLPVDDRLTLVAGGTSGGGGGQSALVAPATDLERRSSLLRLAQLYENYDVVVLDGGSRLDTIAAAADIGAPSILLVTSADRLALAANYALVKSIGARRADAPIAVVANRHGEALAADACEFLAGACAHFLGRTIDLVGAIPDDPCLQAAVGAGMSVRDALDGSPAADAVGGMLSRVLPRLESTAPAVAAVSNVVSTRRWS